MLPYDIDFTIRLHKATKDTFEKVCKGEELTKVARDAIFQRIKEKDKDAYFALLEQLTNHAPTEVEKKKGKKK